MTSSIFSQQLAPAIVLLAAHDSADTVHATLTSIEKQAYPNTRVVVVVDPSSDSTLELVKQFASSSSVPILVITNKSYLGPARSFNRGLLWVKDEVKKALTGETSYLWGNMLPGQIADSSVSLMDTTAVADPNRLIAPMVVFNLQSEVNFIYGDAKNNPVDGRISHVNGWTFRSMWLLNLQKIDIFNTDTQHQDYMDTFVQMLGAGPSYHLEKPVFTYLA